MAYTINLPRFVKVTSAEYFAGSPKENTLYFLYDLGVIYDGSSLMTKGVQTDATNKIPGLFYVIGTGKDAQIVTYASAEAEPTVIAISENAIDAKVKVASDAAAVAQEAADAVAKDLADNYSDTTAVEGLISAAKDEINGNIEDLTAADIGYTQVTEGVVAGATVQAAIEAIDAQLKEIVGTGSDDPQSIAALAVRLGTAEGEIDSLQSVTEGYTGQGAIKTAVDAAQADATQALTNAAAVDAKLGGEFSAESTVKAAIDAAAKAGTDAAAAVDAKLANYSTTAQVDSKISTALASVLKFKGVVADKAALDAITGMVEGDVYYVTAESKEFVYVAQDGKTGWEELGAAVDYDGMLAPYLLIGETFTNGEILVANVNGDEKSAVTTGIKVGGEAFEATPAATTLATEKAVADLLAQMAWVTVMD